MLEASVLNLYIGAFESVNDQFLRSRLLPTHRRIRIGMSQYKFTRKFVFCKRFWQNATSQCFKPKYRYTGRCEWSDPVLPSPSNTEWLQAKGLSNVRSQCCKPVHRCVWRCGWSGPLLPSLSNTQKRLRLNARKASVLNLKCWCYEDVKDDNARCFSGTIVLKICERLRSEPGF